ncbi:MAG: hypothetical protein CML29_03200 [Rhizobiales bacterium]|nr:hypothetical protein [Hyphomicrobiales bacterium]MBA67677.1 hypothetical protein [Hyphomicrobiales bacterium]
MTDPDDSQAALAGPGHSVRNSMIDSERAYRLGPDAVEWMEKGKKDSLRYADISAVNLITYAGTGATIGQAKITSRQGGSFKIRSHHYKGLAQFENRRQTYAPFIRELLGRVARASPDAKFTSGNSAFMIMWLVVAAMMAVLAVVVVMISYQTGDLPLMAIFILLVGGPLAIREVMKGGTKTFDPLDPPERLL